MHNTPYERSRALLDDLHAGCHELAEVNATGMKIIKERPPNFEAIHAIFPNAAKFGVLFAYGDAIYNPDDVTIPLQTIAHECTHRLQQDGTPELWWQRYLLSPQFRFVQELDAHRIEYRVFCTVNNRAERHRYLRYCAEKLSGPLYNHMVSRRVAQQLIELETDIELNARQEVRHAANRSKAA